MPATIPFFDTSLRDNQIFRVIASEKESVNPALEALIYFPGSEAADLSDFGLVLVSENVSCVQAFNWLQLIPSDLPVEANDVIQIDVKHKRIVFLYKNSFGSNSLFLTDLCNSHCIMCPQPPKEKDSVTQESLYRIINCLPPNVEYLGVTGGEPTLLEERFYDVLKLLREKQPKCRVHILSNARKFADWNFASRMLDYQGNITFGVPLYSAIPEHHDFVVQRKGAMIQTLEGLYNLAKINIPVEIRIVLNKQTVNGLVDLAEFIYKNLPFTFHVAFMGMENMGYVKKNWDILWLSPKDYQQELYEAIRYLHIRGIFSSIYNLPFCLLDKSLWGFARDSISDFKKSFGSSCVRCIKAEQCPGLFRYQVGAMPVEPITVAING